MKIGPLLRGYIFELLLGGIPVAVAVLGLATGKVEFNLAVAFGSFGAIVAICTALIKFEIVKSAQDTKREIVKSASNVNSNIGKAVSNIVARASEVQSRTGKIGALIEILDDDPRKYALAYIDTEVLKTLAFIKEEGITPLNDQNYFVALHETMASAGKDWSIYAVSSSSRFRWSDEPRQKRYLEANRAAVDREAALHRVFIVGSSELKSADSERLKAAILEQISSNITVDVVYQESLYSRDQDDDFVIFERPDKSRVLFRGEYHFRERSFLLSGQMMTNAVIIDKYMATFRAMRETLCVSRTELPEILAK